MGRTLVIGDIHGGNKALVQVLERAELKQSDTLIFLGDYVDGWSESFEVVETLMALAKEFKCVFLKGNHESLFLKWLLKHEQNLLWEKHGGKATMSSYENRSGADINRHIAFFESLPLYYVDDQNRLFVHAGFSHIRGAEQEYDKEHLVWDRTLWEVALSLDPELEKNSVFYPKRLLVYKEIFIGHTPVSYIGEQTPVNRANVWNVDTSAAFKGKVSALDIQTKEFFQSDHVYKLYPKELGRNVI